MEKETVISAVALRDETLLIRRILDGQTALFRQLAGRYAGQVLRMVARLIPSPEEAEEVTQDVLFEAYQSLARYDAQKASFQTWLLSIAYHTALKHYRQHRKHIATIDVKQQWLDTIPDAEADALLDDTPDDQMLLNLYYFDNRPVRDIAVITSHDEPYLYSRLQWIRKKLAIIIKTLESNEER